MSKSIELYNAARVCGERTSSMSNQDFDLETEIRKDFESGGFDKRDYPLWKTHVNAFRAIYQGLQGKKLQSEIADALAAKKESKP